MQRSSEYWKDTIKVLTPGVKHPSEFYPTQYQNWLNVYFHLIKDVTPEGTSISIEQSRKLFRIKPLWALTFEQKQFNEKGRPQTSMTSGVFENPNGNAWAFQRELVFDLNKNPMLIERTMDAGGRFQKLALMRANNDTTDLQIEIRESRSGFRLIRVPQIARSIDLSTLLSSPRSIAENIPAQLL